MNPPTPEQIAREAAEKSTLAQWLARYIQHSTFQPVVGKPNPFSAMTHAKITELIQSNITAIILDAIRRAVRDTGAVEALEKIAKKSGEDYDEIDPLATVGEIARSALAKLKAIAGEE